MPYRQWPKADKEALVDDVTRAVLNADVTDRDAHRDVEGERTVGGMLTRIEASLDRLLGRQ